ncbi:MAG: S-methyl-5-thioribose-1-phosphate isomerase [Gemmatimonadota bacterium]|nr:S-methyl-5-thioribose-1-phosphate isomerase [Gemmatimonadota bacterium]
MRSLEAAADGRSIRILDQTELPHAEVWRTLSTVESVAEAITAMRVRGAPLIGITAAWGMVLALRADASAIGVVAAAKLLGDTRPTAVNLRWALDRVSAVGLAAAVGERAEIARLEAEAMMAEDVAACRAIGDHGLVLLREIHRREATDRPLQLLTHCNAGWLATLEYGTALAPVYRAVEEGLPVHVWVDETRPRNQGWLTAWELARSGIPHTVVTDNASGHLLQRGEVDVVIVGTDRTAANGDVCNKVGTWLKALAADEAGVPFFVAVPGSSIDWGAVDGRDIPIEERSARELTEASGVDAAGVRRSVRVGPAGTAVRNIAFDVTPARYISRLITERGSCEASAAGLRSLYPEMAP